jgi:SAM-dependent methyltransferase
MTSKIRYYVPLIGFVVPTLVIGYGFVIPCSVIAGVNQLTIGFGTTILGAVLTYVAGIRLALAPSCPTPGPGRFARYLNRQAASPRGPLGRLLGFIWIFEHRRLNEATLDRLDIAPEHQVLEVGCGPGATVLEASKRASLGHVTGVDVSDAMVASARRRNRRGIEEGRVSIRKVNDGDFALEPASFDRILSVHCLYFWKEPARTLAELTDALRPGGRLLLAFRPKNPDVPARFRDATYRFYAPREVEALLVEAGFTNVRTSSVANDSAIVWVSAER